MNAINHTYHWMQTRYIRLPDHWQSVPRSPLCPATSDSDSENTEKVTFAMGHDLGIRPAASSLNPSDIPSEVSQNFS
ncbi:MAG: hypothetical protein LBI47_00250 [Puniceicoccales bacterium]|nr:hypothetical protein [Puniceicoccales bacterium]